MKSSVPMPVVIAIVAVLVLGVGFFLFKKTGAGGAGDVASMASEMKSKRTDLPVDSKEAAQGDAAFMGSAIKKGGSTAR
jgi:hypothetical protein